MPLTYVYPADAIALDGCQDHTATPVPCTLRTVLLTACRYAAAPGSGMDAAERAQVPALQRLLRCPGLVLLSAEEISTLGDVLLLAGEEAAEEQGDRSDPEVRALAAHWNHAARVLAAPLNSPGGTELDHGIFTAHSDT